MVGSGTWARVVGTETNAIRSRPNGTGRTTRMRISEDHGPVGGWSAPRIAGTGFKKLETRNSKLEIRKSKIEWAIFIGDLTLRLLRRNRKFASGKTLSGVLKP